MRATVQQMVDSCTNGRYNDVEGYDERVSSMKNDGKATIRDIASRCQTSPSTVSRVMNGNTRISEGTRKRVLDAAAELGYMPNPFAKSLRSRTTRIVGVFVNALTPAFETTLGFLSSLSECLEEHGYTASICVIGINAEKERYYYEMMITLRACAIIKIVNCSDSQIDQISTIPIFYVYSYPMNAEKSTQVYRIETDNYGAGYKAGSELVRLGCRRIAEVRLISQSTDYPFARHLGLMQSLYDSEARYAEELSIVCTRNDFGAILEEIEKKLSTTQPADGYFCSSDLMALALLESLNFHGYHIPRQVKIIGCNDMSVSLHSIKRISTIRHRTKELCDATVETMVRVLNGEKPTPAMQRQVFPTDLITRETTVEGTQSDGSSQMAD